MALKPKHTWDDFTNGNHNLDNTSESKTELEIENNPDIEEQEANMLHDLIKEMRENPTDEFGRSRENKNRNRFKQ